jgi:hypothetical protein
MIRLSKINCQSNYYQQAEEEEGDDDDDEMPIAKKPTPGPGKRGRKKKYVDEEEVS